MYCLPCFDINENCLHQVDGDVQKANLEEKEKYRQRLWAFIAKREVPKVSHWTLHCHAHLSDILVLKQMAKQFSTARHTVMANAKRVRACSGLPQFILCP